MPKVSRLTGRTKSSLLGARRNRVIWQSLLGAASESLQTKIDDLAGSAATTEADLKAAAEIRAKEHADFEKSQKELLDVIDTLGRAIAIIGKEMKGGSSMMQLQRATSVLEALSVMVQASSINSADGTTLTALVQNSQNSDETDDIDAAGAFAASVYKSHSRSIVETLDKKSKAESQFAEARQTETTASHNLQMLQQSLEDDLKFNAQDLEAAKRSLGETQGQLTTDTADLKMTEDALAEDTAALEDTTQDCCHSKAAKFEAAVKSRSESWRRLRRREP